MFNLPFLLVLFSLVVLVRVYAIRPRCQDTHKASMAKKAPRDGYKVAVFFGSGGHTTEALKLLSSLDFNRYRRRIYLVSSGDAFSANKARELENTRARTEGITTEGAFDVIELPRARRVHQSLISTPPTFLRSLAVAVYCVAILPGWQGRALADILILNGPGTCVPVVAAVWISRFFGLKSPRMIYVESFARVRTLSLSGKILRRLVDRFVVQWPDLVNIAGGPSKIDHRGWLV